MKARLLSAIVFSLAFTAGALAQGGSTASPAGQGAGSGGGYGQRGGRGMGGGMGMLANGRGITGTVTDVAADHYTVKTETGEVYTIHFSVNTRIMKQAAGQGMGRGAGGGMGRGGGRGMGAGGGGAMGGGANPPLAIKATDIKVGDAIAAMGEVDPATKSVGAMYVVQIDPERARIMREMQANYGKTWLMGKVTAIYGVKVILLGSIDNTAHSFVADENTTFRKRRDPITLADIHVGDTLRAEGTLKDGAFTATTVNVMGAMAGETPTVPRNGPPQ